LDDLLQDLRDYLARPELSVDELETRRWVADSEVRAVRQDPAAYAAFLLTNHVFMWQLAAWHLSDPAFNNAVYLPQPGARMLDFGAGIGTRGMASALAGWQVDFLEPNEPMREFMQLRLTRLGIQSRIVTMLEELQGQQYEMVLCLDVIGHLAEPVETMTALCALVAPGGELRVSWDNWPDGVHGNEDVDFKGIFRQAGLEPLVAGYDTMWKRRHEQSWQ
jgi:2-polyprenyl-3-methyl-5-hydroxy-6-metoxy-1,4-benzoquinol methylase